MTSSGRVSFSRSSSSLWKGLRREVGAPYKVERARDGISIKTETCAISNFVDTVVLSCGSCCCRVLLQLEGIQDIIPDLFVSILGSGFASSGFEERLPKTTRRDRGWERMGVIFIDSQEKEKEKKSIREEKKIYRP